MRRTRTRTRTRNPEFDAAAEARIERAVAYFEKVANSALASLEEPGSPRFERFFDAFLRSLDSNKDDFAERAREVLENEERDLATVSEATLLEAVNDSTIYDFSLNSTENKRPDSVWSLPVGKQSIIHSNYKSIIRNLAAEGFSNDEWRETQNRLRNKDITITSLYGLEEPEALDTVKVWANAGSDWTMDARINRTHLVDKLRELIATETVDTQPDDVVYRYAGTNDTVAGASARGFYVASLRPDQLKAEGAALGICVGRGDMGYKRWLTMGEIQIFSIRTEAGESKFCIDRDVPTGEISQVKGTANRLPGFEPGAKILTKPDEVRLVVEFLQELGYDDKTIAEMNDIGSGVRTMLDNGINPFIPPPKRQRPVLSPEEREARRLAAMSRRAAENPALIPSPETAAMIQEDYAHPWGGRWGT